MAISNSWKPWQRSAWRSTTAGGRSIVSLLNALIREKLRNAARKLRRLPDALELVWSAGKHWTLLWAALLVVEGLLPAGTVYRSLPTG